MWQVLQGQVWGVKETWDNLTLWAQEEMLLFMVILKTKVTQEGLCLGKVDLTVQVRMKTGNRQDSTKALRLKLVTSHQRKCLGKEVRQGCLIVTREASTREEKAAQEEVAPWPILVATMEEAVSCPGLWEVHLPTCQ